MATIVQRAPAFALHSTLSDVAPPSASHEEVALPPAPPTSSQRPKFVLGSRNSKLAMVQATLVSRQLQSHFPELDISIHSMTTLGDQNLAEPLYVLGGSGGKALWTTELEQCLLSGRVDAVVHSLKDVPTEFPQGCELGAVLEREDPSDALVVRKGLDYRSLEDLPDGSVVGTSSVRRVAQLRRCFPKLRFADVRGNLGTRLAKLDSPTRKYSALILASAGLIRLGLSSRITCPITAPYLYHAVGQGALGIEIRSSDSRSAAIVAKLDDWETSWTTSSERSLLRYLEGGCSVPVGCGATLVEIAGSETSSESSDSSRAANVTLTGTITSLSGLAFVIASRTAVVESIEDAESLGQQVAVELIAKGGRAILEELSKHVKEIGQEEGKEVPFEPRGLAQADAVVRTVFLDVDECQRPLGW
ncbi:hypothetical protein RQP46_010476 [Phenoliferia psychrophenolica]